MSLAQGNPFVLSYRLHIIGLAQECNWVTCRVSFTIFSHNFCKPSRFSVRQSGQLGSNLAS